MTVTLALPARKVPDAATLRAAITQAAAMLPVQAAPGCGCAAPEPCPRCAARAWAQVPLGPPNDSLEAEAERVASALDRMPTTAASGADGQEPPPAGGRAAPGSADARRTVEAPSAPAVGRGSLAERPLSVAPQVLRQALSGGGAPLDPATRAHFERTLGYDFSRVRVHADARAGAAARAVSSRAFTWGHHVAFAPGQYAPKTTPGRRLLAHELVHVVQQSGRPRSAATEETDYTEVQTAHHGGVQRSPMPAISAGVLACQSMVQRDFALEPPHPAAVPRVLTPQQLQEAIDYDQRVVTVIGPAGIEELRDVLGISSTPAVIDQDFVEAVQRWQAVQGIDTDGKLGPESAARLFHEIGAEQVGRAELVSGPTYRATASLTPPVDGAGLQSTSFRFNAEFRNDPVNGIFASCGEIRQFIQWDAASAAALPLGRPHGGFPAGTAAGTWIEDRNGTDTLRYGHRRSPHLADIAGNEYVDTDGNRNPAFGHIYRGRDFPGGPAGILAGHWRFFVRAYDVCNGRKVLGTDYLRITW